MKITNSIRTHYQKLEESYKLLKGKVDNSLENRLPKEWHYISRVKEIESFALKIESGRYKSIEKFDDFFACTVVVENALSIKKAKKIILDRFYFVYQKPRVETFTHKHPDSFPFDDLRLYVKWLDEEGSKPTGLNGLLFEVQIKTFLQHAWAIATHDLIYKSDEKNWAKERIAFQIKAMFEHAEVSIFEAEKLSKSISIKNTNKETKQITQIIKVLNDLWTPTLLPSNLKLLAGNINKLIIRLSLSPSELKKILIEETKKRLGTKSLNLSPYGVIIQALFNQYPDKMVELLSKEDRSFSLYVHREINIPNNISSSSLKGSITF